MVIIMQGEVVIWCLQQKVCLLEGQRRTKSVTIQSGLNTTQELTKAWLLRLRLAASLVFPTTCLEELEQFFTNCSFDKRERGFQ